MARPKKIKSDEFIQKLQDKTYFKAKIDLINQEILRLEKEHLILQDMIKKLESEKYEYQVMLRQMNFKYLDESKFKRLGK